MERKNSLFDSFLVNRERQREDVVNKSIVTLSSLTPSCDIILDVCLSLVDRATGKNFYSDNPCSPAMFLAAQFLRGFDITRMSILTGAYHQAANLLKQEMEITCAMYEYRNEKRWDKRTVKFKGSMSDLGSKYGELNNIAHPTHEHVVKQFASTVSGEFVNPTLDIQFNSQLCRSFFSLHSTLVLRFFAELKQVIAQGLSIELTDEEEHLVRGALQTLVAEGACTKNPQPSG